MFYAVLAPHVSTECSRIYVCYISVHGDCIRRKVVVANPVTFGDEDKILMATRHGSIGEFDPSVEEWKSYTERLEQYFVANDVENAEKRRAILLSVCGPSTYQLVRNLVAPSKPTEKSFEEIVTLVKEYHHPPPSVIVERFNFNSRTKKEGESVADFVAQQRK